MESIYLLLLESTNIVDSDFERNNFYNILDIKHIFLFKIGLLRLKILLKLFLIQYCLFLLLYTFSFYFILKFPIINFPIYVIYPKTIFSKSKTSPKGKYNRLTIKKNTGVHNLLISGTKIMVIAI